MFQESDIAKIIWIFGQAANNSGSPEQKRQDVLDAVANFLGAEKWYFGKITDQSDKLELKFHTLVAEKDNYRLVLGRKKRGKKFTARERALFFLITRQVDWLLKEAPSEGSKRPPLSPRMKTICLFVCLGAGRKEIAGALGLEHGTVDGYIRDLYRIYGVQSQKELIRLHAGDPIPGSRRYNRLGGE